MPRFGSLLCAMLAGAACAGSSPYETAVSGTHSATGKASAGIAAASGGVSSTGDTTAATGSTSGVSSGGSSGTSGTSTGTSCPSIPCATLDACASGQAELCAQVTDFFTGKILQTPIQFQDLDDPLTTPESNACGELVLCVTPGSVISPYVSAPGYYTSILNDIQLEHSEYFNDAPLAQSNVFQDALAGLTPPLDVNQAMVGVKVVTQTGESAQCSVSGWSFLLLGPDGGAVPADVASLSGLQPSPGKATNGSGVALLYNIDPAYGEVTIVGNWDGGLDAGCVFAGELHQYLPSVRLQAQAISAMNFDVALPCGPGSPSGGLVYAPCDIASAGDGFCFPFETATTGAYGLCLAGTPPGSVLPATCGDFGTTDGNPCPIGMLCYTDYTTVGTQCQPVCGADPVASLSGPGCDGGEVCVPYYTQSFGSCAPSCAAPGNCAAPEACLQVAGDGGAGSTCEP